MKLIRRLKTLTLPELMVVIGILLILFAIGLQADRSSFRKEASESEWCKWYKYSSIQDMPVACLKYYTNGNEPVIVDPRR